MKYTSKSLEETQKVARDFVSKLDRDETVATVVGLYGDLGAGKTTFTQGVARALGIEESVVSPTFVIEKIYEIVDSSQHMVYRFKHLIHIDAYRIEKSDELLHLGWQDIISDPKNLVFIEWPERVKDILPEHVRVTFNHISENEREIEIL